MNNAWHSFLSRQGAQLDSDGRIQFSDAVSDIKAAASGNVLADLSHLALIQVTGADAEAFLLGQLTNDLKQVDNQHSQLSAYCTPKGRMLAIFRINIFDNGYLLQLPAALAESIVARLRTYVMRSKVVLDISETLICIGIAGSGVEDALKSVAIDAPKRRNASTGHDGLLVTRLPGDHPRFTLIANTEAAQTLWQSLASALTPVGSAAWSWLEIRAGQPVVLPETVEAFVPQMTNLDLIDGVNFKKGCYPGQEIVARMQYLGKLKQRMFSAMVDTDVAPKPGDRLFAPGFREQSVGTLVDAQPGPEKGYDLLAVVQLEAVNAGELRLGDSDGPILELTDLPYEIPREIAKG